MSSPWSAASWPRPSRRWLPACLASSLLLATASLASATTAASQPPGGPTVRPEVPVTAVNLETAQANNSPGLAEDPTEPRVLALASRVDAPDFGCALHISGDGGRGWLPAQPVPNLPPGAEKCYAPEVAFDGNGVLYYLFVGLSGPTNTPMGVFLTTSSNRGRTFSPPRRLLGARKFMVRMAVDRTRGDKGRMHLVWLDATDEPSLGGLPPGGSPLLAAHSDDGGNTFSPPVVVSDPERKRVVAPALALGAQGAVHVAYYDLRDDAVDYQGLEGPTWEGHWSLVVSTSSDGGRRFERGVVADDQVVPPERVTLIFTMPAPALAADGQGRLYAAWHDGRHRHWDVFLRPSPDGGRSWEEPRRLNDDALGSPRHQYLPRLSVSADGRLDAIFYDRRNDPANVRNDVYLTYSVDQARSFAPNVKLTGESSSSEVGPRYPIPSAAGKVEFGSRLALVSSPDAVMAAWTDTRNSLPGEQQDVFATEARFGPGPDGPRRRDGRLPTVPLVGGGVLAVAMAVVAVAWARRRSSAARPGAGTQGQDVAPR